ncbi:MAG: class I SAM-dependent methyltransferase [Pseudomonadota bacterium]
MDSADIEEVHGRLSRPGYGTLTPDELAFVQRAVTSEAPDRVIEIGTGAGLTAGIIAGLLAKTGGTSVTSIDAGTRFFAAPDLAIGHLAAQVYSGDAVRIDIRTGTRSIDLTGTDGPWQLAVIDADHAHPWPILDTMALWPHLTGNRTVLHHNLQQFRRNRPGLGIGPRVLFNEVPEAHRHASPAGGWNIFAVDLRMRQRMFEEVALNALSIPWTVRPPLEAEVLDQFRSVMKPHFSDGFWREFDECVGLNRWSRAKRLYFAARRGAAGLRR